MLQEISQLGTKGGQGSVGPVNIVHITTVAGSFEGALSWGVVWIIMF